MIALTLPVPVAVERYWKTSLPKGAKMPRTVVTHEGRLYREMVRGEVSRAGVDAPLAGRVWLSCVLYPDRPDDWRERFRRDPAYWDDSVACESLDGMERVLVDALAGVVFESGSAIRKMEAERAVPDGHARVEVRVEQVQGELVQRPSAERGIETGLDTGYRYPPGTMVATPSGRPAVVLRYLNGTGGADMFERAICRYLDATSKKECVTLQPRYLRRID